MDGNARRSLMLNRFHFGTIRPEWIRKTHSLCVVCVCNMLNGMLYCCWANMSERVLSCMLGVAEQRIRERMPFADNVLCAVHTSYISICELWLWLASVRSSVLLHSSLFMYISLYGCVFLYIVLFIFSVFSFCSIFFFCILSRFDTKQIVQIGWWIKVMDSGRQSVDEETWWIMWNNQIIGYLLLSRSRTQHSEISTCTMDNTQNQLQNWWFRVCMLRVRRSNTPNKHKKKYENLLAIWLCLQSIGSGRFDADISAHCTQFSSWTSHAMLFLMAKLLRVQEKITNCILQNAPNNYLFICMLEEAKRRKYHHY